MMLACMTAEELPNINPMYRQARPTEPGLPLLLLTSKRIDSPAVNATGRGTHMAVLAKLRG